MSRKSSSPSTFATRSDNHVRTRAASTPSTCWLTLPPIRRTRSGSVGHVRSRTLRRRLRSVGDVTDATFQTAVIDRSHEVPVVVDLWAPWCGPCRTLGPIIEKVVAGTDGKVELAKVDTDANPGVANAFQVQSIPAVYALKDGKVVDGF